MNRQYQYLSLSLVGLLMSAPFSYSHDQYGGEKSKNIISIMTHMLTHQDYQFALITVVTVFVFSLVTIRIDRH